MPQQNKKRIDVRSKLCSKWCTPPKTNISLKINGWKMKVLFEMVPFRGDILILWDILGYQFWGIRICCDPITCWELVDLKYHARDVKPIPDSPHTMMGYLIFLVMRHLDWLKQHVDEMNNHCCCSGLFWCTLTKLRVVFQAKKTTVKAQHHEKTRENSTTPRYT